MSSFPTLMWMRASLLAFLFIVPAQAADTRVYKDRVNPHWFANNSRFWYRNDLPNDGREFIVVDAEAGKRTPAFDREAVAKQINADAKKLPINELKFSNDGERVQLLGSDKSWNLD